jgi:hypothetical protein
MIKPNQTCFRDVLKSHFECDAEDERSQGRDGYVPRILNLILTTALDSLLSLCADDLDDSHLRLLIHKHLITHGC